MEEVLLFSLPILVVGFDAWGLISIRRRRQQFPEVVKLVRGGIFVCIVGSAAGNCLNGLLISRLAESYPQSESLGPILEAGLSFLSVLIEAVGVWLLVKAAFAQRENLPQSGADTA